MDKPELLSPAGDYECFIAAINAGADAVYLGASRFSARANARNLSEDDLIRALDIAHINGKKIYLTVNTLVKEHEMDDLYDLLYVPYMNGLDAVIVQDTGVMSFIRDNFPDIPIHVSTQAAVTDTEGALFFKDLGATRIVPARELSLDEIKAMVDQTGMELECFIHGSLCYSYSGKCLLSSFIGGRSGNRGRCAQPCRLSYDGKYPLSLKDLCTIDIIPELIDAGIRSFKIEGRMKSSSYVYGVTSIYRKYIDMWCELNKYCVDDDNRKRLISYYTRSGNCQGYYHMHNGRDMITPDSPSYISNDGDDNDGIMTEPARKISITCTIRKREPVTVSADLEGHHVHVVTDVVPEEAVNAALTCDGVRKQLVKCGNTGFEVEDITLILDDGLFIPNGKLNSIRRKVISDLKDEILAGFRRPEADGICKKVYTQFNRHGSVNGSCTPHCRPSVKICVLNEEQFEYALKTEADALIIPSELYSSLSEKGMSLPAGKDLYIRLPYIIRGNGRSNSPEKIKELIAECEGLNEIKGFYVSDHEAITILRNCQYNGRIIGDIHLYVFNRRSFVTYMNTGVTGFTYPVEQNERELEDLDMPGQELIVYGRLPVMISANCIYNTKNGCEYRLNGHDIYITDRKGCRMFVRCDCSSCTNVIYNSVRLDITDQRRIFKKLLPSAVRFDFTDETGPQLSSLMKGYFASVSSEGYTEHILIADHTRGHINRGVD